MATAETRRRQQAERKSQVHRTSADCHADDSNKSDDHTERMRNIQARMIAAGVVKGPVTIKGD